MKLKAILTFFVWTKVLTDETMYMYTEGRRGQLWPNSIHCPSQNCRSVELWSNSITVRPEIVGGGIMVQLKVLSFSELWDG